MHAYDTVSEALTDLKDRGYTTDFNIAFDKLECSTTRKCLYANDFEIVEHYRFEGESDPGDESVVYAIEQKSGTMKGVVVTAYGTYSEPVSDDMITKLSIQG
ncbi:phosphoribosylpyrophosphate synthetase [Segetibacter sp. 3557_3]|nr:phosphoribosylpyrophosphate synthetase [Segetibacter sp. 3557_3]